jgi:hypothetical protein
MDATLSLYRETGDAIEEPRSKLRGMRSLLRFTGLIYVKDDRKANRLSGRHKFTMVI